MSDATDTRTNRYLSGPYAPVHDELTLVDLEVEGTLPEELSGRYLRNGPNPVGQPDPGTYHWFSGDGMVHGIAIDGGRAGWYRNRWVRSTGVSDALGEEPKPGERNGGMDTANTNVVGIGGRTFAIVEAGARPVELGDELDTIEHSDLGGTLPNGYTAHPKVDPDTGLIHAVSYYWARPNLLEYTVIDPATARVTRRVDVPVPGNPMTHDCSITEGHVVFYDLPVTFNVDAAVAGLFPYRWDDDYGARVGVMPLSGSADDVRWFEVDPCYVFHPSNAHEVSVGDHTEIVLDVVRHESMFRSDVLGPNEGPPTLWRWRIPLDGSSSRVAEEPLDDRAIEFPRVDERRVGRTARRSWATTLSADSDVGFDGSSLRIFDDGAEPFEVDFGSGRSGGEAVFVPRTPEAGETDGWFMVLVSEPDGTSSLELRPGGDPREVTARVRIPARIPIGFHGNWVPDVA